MSSKFLGRHSDKPKLLQFFELKRIFFPTEMDKYLLIIDISSDDENQRNSTPIKTLPVNILGTLNLSDSSVEVWRSSEADLDSSTLSASTFEIGCSPKKIKINPIKKKRNAKVTFKLGNDQDTESEDDYFEKPETPRQVPPLQPTRVLREISNFPPTSDETTAKTNAQNDLNEPPLENLEAIYELDLEDKEY